MKRHHYLYALLGLFVALLATFLIQRDRNQAARESATATAALESLAAWSKQIDDFDAKLAALATDPELDQAKGATLRAWFESNPVIKSGVEPPLPPRVTDPNALILPRVPLPEPTAAQQKVGLKTFQIFEDAKIRAQQSETRLDRLWQIAGLAEIFRSYPDATCLEAVLVRGLLAHQSDLFSRVDYLFASISDDYFGTANPAEQKAELAAMIAAKASLWRAVAAAPGEYVAIWNPKDYAQFSDETGALHLVRLSPGPRLRVIGASAMQISKGLLLVETSPDSPETFLSPNEYATLQTASPVAISY